MAKPRMKERRTQEKEKNRKIGEKKKRSRKAKKEYFKEENPSE